MDISIINDAIRSLELEEENFENISELASLYTVRNNMTQMSSFSNEVSDIFPSYKKYCNCKKRYQLGQTNEGEVIHDLKLLGKEISEFLFSLYSGTDMLKERKYIIEELTSILNKINT